MAMKNVHNLHKRGFLTDQQLLVAGRFVANPQAFILPPTLFRILFDIIIKDVPLEEVERVKGWAARSAKVVLSQILYALQELGGLVLPVIDTAESDLVSEVKFLRGDDDPAISEAMMKYRLTGKQARVFAVLRGSEGRAVSSDAIMRRVYEGGAGDDVPDDKIIRVMVFYIRKKIAADWDIRTVWGEGYALFPVGNRAGK